MASVSSSAARRRSSSPARIGPTCRQVGAGGRDGTQHRVEALVRYWILRHWPPSMTSSEPVMNDAWLRHQKRHRVGHLGRLADPAERRRRGQPRLGVRVQHRCRDGPGEHRVDPDSRGRQFGGGGLGQPAQRPFRRPVGGVVRERPDRAGAAGVDDGRAVGGAQLLQHRLDTEEGAQTVDPPGPFEAVSRLVGNRRAVQRPGVVDQRGQRPEPVDRRQPRPAAIPDSNVTSSGIPITASSSRLSTAARARPR